MASSSVRSWSNNIKFLAFVIMAAGVTEIVFSFVWTGGYSYGWSALTIGILYILCGISGVRAGIAKQLAAARQYFRLLIVTAVALSVMEIVYLALTNVFVNTVYGDCDYSTSSCDLDADTLRLALLLSGFISLGITLVCCACCIGCAKSYVHALEVENYPTAQYVAVSPTTAGYQATPAYPAYPAYPYPQPSYNQPNYNQHVPAPSYTAPLYPQVYQPNAYQAPPEQPTYQQNQQNFQHTYQQNAHSPNQYQPNAFQPDASNKV